MATKYDISIDQGADFVRILTIRSDVGALLDLTGCSFTAKAKVAYTDKTWAFSFTFAIADQVANPGQVTMSIPHAALATLKLSQPTKYIYNVDMTDANSIITRLFEGTATVNPGVNL